MILSDKSPGVPGPWDRSRAGPRAPSSSSMENSLFHEQSGFSWDLCEYLFYLWFLGSCLVKEAPPRAPSARARAAASSAPDSGGWDFDIFSNKGLCLAFAPAFYIPGRLYQPLYPSPHPNLHTFCPYALQGHNSQTELYTKAFLFSSLGAWDQLLASVPRTRIAAWRPLSIQSLTATPS